MPYRSNIPYLSDYCLTPVDAAFPARAKAEKGGILVAGQNYGQGSSREHAALVPLYLGIRAVVAKSFARIHQANLINNGILPVEIDTSFIREGDCVQVRMDGDTITVTDETTRQSAVCPAPGGKVREILNAGGLVPYMIQQKKKK